jgi:dTMP kinase
MSEFRYMGHQMPYLPTMGRTGRLIVLEGTDGVGRSTQAAMLKEWLEVQGYAVMETGWTRSKLVGQAITDAKAGHSLNRLTYCLMYATDLADRMEYQILPALRSGFIVLADRYVYTMIARGIARGADKQWLRDLYGFAVQPDLILHLRITVQDLVPRVLAAGKMNYWESGLDMNYGDDLFDSFVAYQGALIEQFDEMSEEFGFVSIDARQDTRTLQRQLRQAVAHYLEPAAEIAQKTAQETSPTGQQTKQQAGAPNHPL